MKFNSHYNSNLTNCVRQKKEKGEGFDNTSWSNPDEL